MPLKYGLCSPPCQAILKLEEEEDEAANLTQYSVRYTLPKSLQERKANMTHTDVRKLTSSY